MATAATTFRDYETDGVPASGSHKVKKSDVRQLLLGYENIINAFTANGGLIYGSKASLDADLAHAANSMAWVIGDATTANNGVYRKIGASGTGSWTRMADLPFSFIIASDAGGGAANAIQATTSLPVSGSALIWMNIFEANTASPVTVSFNGGTALTIKTNSGNDVAVGGLTAGMIVMGIVSGTTFRLVSDQASAAIVAQAESYANAAAAAANAGFVFDTEADFVAANIPLTLQFVQTAGYYAPGDGGGHLKKRISTPVPVEAWHKQSADGAWWQISPDQVLSVEAFGAVGWSKSELEALDGDASTDTIAAANTVATQNAVDFRLVFGGGIIHAMKQFYAISGMGVQKHGGVEILCAGRSKYEPVYPSRVVGWEGTTWLLKGTGTKHLTFSGITSNEHGGGWREDPDAPGTYYKQFSSYNSDAVGTTPATPKFFSAGFWCVEEDYSRISNCRVIPWNGQNGIEGYDDPAGGLGDDWDFGIVTLNCEGAMVDRVQTIGYFREAGFAAFANIAIESKGEKCKFTDVMTQGRWAGGMRGADRRLITATGVDWFEIRWDSEHYFDPNGGTPIRLSDNVNRTYTNTTMNGAFLRFNGVSPSPAGMFHVRHAGVGWAGTVARNFHGYSLFHHGGSAVETLGLQKAASLQISGFPLRGILFDGKAKIHCGSRAGERALLQAYDATDITFAQFQPEGGRWMFGTDFNGNVAYCLSPVGESRNIRFLNSESVDELRTAGYLDQTWTPRTTFDPGLQDTPRSDLTGNRRILPPRSGKSVIIGGNALEDFFDCREITVNTAGLSFVTVTSQTCTFRYIKIGKLVHFKMALTWSGLDTADTSAISIRLPVDTSGGLSLFNAVVNDRRSTGINLASVDNPYVDLATDNFMGISRSDATRLAYNGGQIAASGELYISGSYWVD